MQLKISGSKCNKVALAIRHDIIKTVACRHIENFSIIFVEYKTLRDGILAVKNKDLLGLEIKGDSKIVVDCYNKKINIFSYIFVING